MFKNIYKIFEHWYHNNKGTIYLYSDPHFNDEESCKFRRFDNLKDYNESQIKSINSTVGKYDTLIILGDVGDVEFVKKLHCYKVLIKGNHDKGSSNYIDVFDEVYEGPLTISNKIILSHEPINIDYMLNIHGHEHHFIYRDNHINVCAEHIGYKPIKLNDIIKSGKLKDVKDIHEECVDRRLKFRETEEFKKYGQPDDILEYKGFVVYFWVDDYGQQMFTVWNGEELGFGAYNLSYKDDMKYLIDRKLNRQLEEK